MSDYLPLPKILTDRTKGQIYINKKGTYVKWDRERLRRQCECGKAIPSYNYEDETKAICCVSCKKDNMVNVIKKKCECGKATPRFNYEDETKAICCSSCKKDNMVNIIDKKCECGKALPSYNYEGETRAICCSSCKKDNMVHVKNKKCKTHLCFTIISNEKYEGYCLRCFIYTFPDKPVARNYKTKEYAVVEYITQEFPDYTWIADKQIQDGCSKKRPDLLLDLGFQIVNIEIDENQHEDYDCSCENKRIMQLSQDVGHRPIVFIRFNPDSYIKDGKKITSCWKYNKQGICVLNKSKQKEWEQRLETLKNQIIYWLDESNITDKTIETIQLFYNE